MILNLDDTEFMVMLKPSCIIYTISVERGDICTLWNMAWNLVRQHFALYIFISADDVDDDYPIPRTLRLSSLF